MYWPTSLAMKGTLLLLIASGLFVASESSFPECGDHPVCLLEGFGEDSFCCPDENGTYKDCCHRAECTVHPVCADAGLEGFCCPTVAGDYLACCDTTAPSESPSITSAIGSSTSHPSQAPSETGPALCSENPVCASYGINGQCCPSPAGVRLACCDEVLPTKNPSATNSPTQTPSSPSNTTTTTTTDPSGNPSQTATIAPSGNPSQTATTAPSDSPSQTSVLSTTSSQCSAHSQCATLGLGGECCPTRTGMRLNCCDEEGSTSTTSSPSTMAPNTSNPTLLATAPPTKVPTTSSPSNSPTLPITNSPITNAPTATSIVLTPSPSDAGISSQCSAHTECAVLGLGGECCPTRTGVELNCCDPVPATFSSPSKSPTPGPSNFPSNGFAETSDNRAGSESSSPLCSANTQCAVLGLTGDCCPTAVGVQLDCCDYPDMPTPTTPPTDDAAQCSANSECASLGLLGDCCPTSVGVYLNCCEMPESDRATSAQCSSNPGCASLGLTGDCCPTALGIELDCCGDSTSTTTSAPTTMPTESPPTFASCSANAACSILGLAGECCPTTNGVQLSCCDQTIPNTTGPPTENPTPPPTKNPTPSPTKNPTPPPTSGGFSFPTNQPTSPPTSGGFSFPTKQPTKNPTPPPTPPPTAVPSGPPTRSPTGPTQSGSKCSGSPGCAILGLQGDCCPTSAGVFLGCCAQDAAVSSPTPAPSSDFGAPFGPTTTQPTAENQLRFIADDDVSELPPLSLGKCEADCDSDSDCALGLICFQRDIAERNVPGCVGDASLVNDGDDDFCIEPPSANTLVLFGDDGDPTSAFPLGECQGDCDEDTDCAEGLSCFQRNGEEGVPNCIGEGVGGFDYCYRPSTDLKFVGDYEMAYYELELCQGDCDFDSDCLLGLVCYQRGNLDGPDVPGCVGDASSIATGGEDFCIERPTSNWLNIVYDFEDDIGTYPIGRCSADCETDEDCEGSLICFSRTNEDDPVPGCIGEGEEAYSYCI